MLSIMREMGFKYANAQKLEVWGLTKSVRYYYQKYDLNEHGQAIGGTATVCIIRLRSKVRWVKSDLGMEDVGSVDGRLLEYWNNEPMYVVGQAYCNPKDQFRKKVGRNIALGRAIKAMENGRSSEPSPINLQAFLPVYYMSVYDYMPSDFELKLWKR